MNTELYNKIKAAILSGDYMLNEVQDVLEWILSEYARKFSGFRSSMTIHTVEQKPDIYDTVHRYADRSKA